MLRRQAVVVVSLILIGLLCVNNVQAQSIKQWAIDATANSEFTSTRFSAAQMVGAPDTYPDYGDIETAWAPAYWDLDGVRVELRYAEPVIVEEIEIYETCNPSAITKVELVDEAGFSYEVWRGDAWVAPKESRIFRIRNTKVKTPVNRVRLYLDCSKVDGWNEIDAVGITGTRLSQGAGPTQTASSYDSPLTELDVLLARLEGAIKRATERNSANPIFLKDLESIVRELQSISNRLHGELGASTSEWGDY